MPALTLPGIVQMLKKSRHARSRQSIEQEEAFQATVASLAALVDRRERALKSALQQRDAHAARADMCVVLLESLQPTHEGEGSQSPTWPSIRAHLDAMQSNIQSLAVDADKEVINPGESVHYQERLARARQHIASKGQPKSLDKSVAFETDGGDDGHVDMEITWRCGSEWRKPLHGWKVR